MFYAFRGFNPNGNPFSNANEMGDFTFLEVFECVHLAQRKIAIANCKEALWFQRL